MGKTYVGNLYFLSDKEVKEYMETVAKVRRLLEDKYRKEGTSKLVGKCEINRYLIKLGMIAVKGEKGIIKQGVLDNGREKKQV